jgi:hypothetical protein
MPGTITPPRPGLHLSGNAETVPLTVLQGDQPLSTHHV